MIHGSRAMPSEIGCFSVDFSHLPWDEEIPHYQLFSPTPRKGSLKVISDSFECGHFVQFLMLDKKFCCSHCFINIYETYLVFRVVNHWWFPFTIFLIIPVIRLLSIWVRNQFWLVPVLGNMIICYVSLQQHLNYTYSLNFVSAYL